MLLCLWLSSFVLTVDVRTLKFLRVGISSNKYFYLTDQIAQGTVEVHYCPTEAMTADYMTKPLQGQLFKIHKKNNMGTPPN